MPNHPLKVYYPYGGQHYLLEWKTRNGGHHLIVSKTFSGFLTAVRSIYLRYSESYQFEFFSPRLAKIVAPPQKLCQWAEILEKKRLIDDFAQTVLLWWAHYCNDNEINHTSQFTLPHFLAWCPNSERGGLCSGCNNFDSHVKLTISKEELFARYHQLWLEKFPPNQDPFEGSYSLAEEASDDDLYCASLDFGHHRAGLLLQKINVENNSFNQAVGFYYQNPTGLSIGEQEKFGSFVASLLLEKKRLEELREDLRKQRLLERKKQQEVENQTVLKLFGILC